jgi:ABC-type dipeptide/oligopeptide/nickel transport system permease subunit
MSVDAEDLTLEPTLPRRRLSMGRVPGGLAVGGAIVLTLALVAVAAPVIAPTDPYAQSLSTVLQPPSRAHLFGTDALGRDILSRIVYGARYELGLAIPPVLLALCIALPLGMSAGYLGGWTDRVVTFLTDTVLTLPSLVLAIIMVAVLGSGTLPLVATLVVTQTPPMVRYVRGFSSQVAAAQFILAARSSGSTVGSILLRHIARNILGPVLVISSLFASEAVLVIAALGFLGIGVQPPAAEWGTMLNEGRVDFLGAPHVMVFPGLAIALLILGFNLLGDGLRDRLDTR